MAVTVYKQGVTQYEVADCPAGAAVGELVYFSADKVAGVYQVDVVDWDDESKMPARAMIVRKTGTRCIIQMGGNVRDVYTGLTPQSDLFVGSSGRLTQTLPGGAVPAVRCIQRAAFALSSSVVRLTPETSMIR